MNFFKTKLFLLFVLLAVAGTFYYFGDPQKLIEAIATKLQSSSLSPLAEKVETIDTTQINTDFKKSIENTQAEIVGFSQKTLEVSEHAGNILGSSITTAPKDQTTPLHEKALEYGQYIYCQQVVAQYEKNNQN